MSGEPRPAAGPTNGEHRPAAGSMSGELRFATVAELAAALRRAAAAHGRHEEQLGHFDEGWPDWYADYMFTVTGHRPPGDGPSGSSSGP